MVITICSSCNKKIDVVENSDSRFTVCKTCQRFIPIGAGSKQYLLKNEKGGHNMVQKKTAKKTVKMETQKQEVSEKTPKAEKAKKFSDEIKAEVIALAKDGMSYKDISKKYNGSPNPNAVKRWVEKSK